MAYDECIITKSIYTSIYIMLTRIRNGCFISEILTTHLDESWTRHFQLGLTKIFKF